MRKLLLSFCLVIFCLVSFGQVYQEMPQYGYRANRMAFDSTLQIPTVCGVPTLKSVVSVSKKAAIAFDSCNNKFYKYNPKTLTWSEISGGGGSGTVTSITIQPPLTGDSIKTTGTIGISQADESTDGYLSFADWNTFNNKIGTIPGLDEVLQQNEYGGNHNIHLQTTNRELDLALNGSLYAEPFLYIEYSDKNALYTSDRIKYNCESCVGGLYAGYQYLKSNATYANQTSTLPSTSGWLVNKVNNVAALEDGSVTIPTIDTIKRIAGKDSIIFYKGGFRYAIKDSVGGGQNGRFGNDTATIVMAKVHNDAGVILTNGKVVAFSSSGTSSDVPSVRLANNKGDSTSANTFGFVSGTIAINDTGWIILSGKIEKLNTSAFSNGDIIYLDSVSGNWVKTKPVAPYHMVYLGVVVKANAGNGSIFVKCQNGYELDEIHDVQINGKLNNQVLAYSDTQKVWKNKNIYSIIDTIGTSNRINAKVNISDTSAMLSTYLRKVDTASLSSRINLKVNISDTSAMLSKYMRKSDTTSMLVPYLRKSDTTAMLSPYFKKSDTSSLSNRIDSKNYAIGLGGTAITVNASTTYYFGTPAQSVTNSAAIRRIYIPVSGTLKGGQIYAKTTTATTTESWTLSLRLNNTSNTTFATVGNILTDKVFGTSSLNIAVVAGDYIEITTTTPAWVTGPGATFFYGTIFIQ